MNESRGEAQALQSHANKMNRGNRRMCIENDIYGIIFCYYMYVWEKPWWDGVIEENTVDIFNFIRCEANGRIASILKFYVNLMDLKMPLI